jgi:hypothetical protein
LIDCADASVATSMARTTMADDIIRMQSYSGSCSAILFA